jgi:hypothetical protein
MARSASGTTDRAPFRSARLNGDQHGDRAPVLQLPTPFDLRLGTANPRVVDLHVAVERLPRRIDHRSPQFVEEHPGGFIPAQPELALQQERRDAALIGRHQIRGPEPVGQRGLRVVQDGSRRQRYLMSAVGTLPAALRHGVRCPQQGRRNPPASDTSPDTARGFGRELTLKLAQILRKRRARHAPPLQIVAC